MNRHKQTPTQVCSLAYLHTQVSVPHVILRIRFPNSYSKNGSILFENLDALAHAHAHAEAHLTSYGSERRLKFQVV